MFGNDCSIEITEQNQSFLEKNTRKMTNRKR